MMMEVIEEMEGEKGLGMERDEDLIEAKGRNSRKPKKANHGARPCSSYMRKLKIKGWYRKMKNVS